MMRVTETTLAVLCAIAGFFPTVALSQAADSPAAIENLQCEYRADPLGIDIVNPRLSWEMRDARRGAKQTAYQILVATSAEKLAADQGDLWDTGKVVSNQTTQIVYAGKPLVSRMQCFWKVRLWDADGKVASYSKPALWTMGLLNPDEFKAKWIGLDSLPIYPGTVQPKLPTLDGCAWFWTGEKNVDPKKKAPKGNRYFRKVIDVPEDKVVSQAMFMVSGDDTVRIIVNQQAVGVATGWKSPQSVNVANAIVPGKNCLAVLVENAVESPACLMGKLVIDFKDGQTMECAIDGSWKTAIKGGREWNTLGFDDSKWTPAKKIGNLGDGPWGEISKPKYAIPYACPLLRKEFNVQGPVRRATIYASALGNYRMYINGKPVGDDFFTPDWTDYKKRVYYNAYDVTDLIRANGPNAVGGVLAAGWYAGGIGWGSLRCHYGENPRLFAQLEIELADGTIQTIATDESWKTAFGPYVIGEFLAGETYDATKEIAGWDSPGLDDSTWAPVAVADPIKAKLLAFPGVTVQETSVLRPIKITEPKPGTYVFDMGQNFAGFARLKASGPAGTKITLRFAEMLNPDGTIYTTNLRGAKATDVYTLKGHGEEVWQPRFTFHGFRYVEVTGYPGKPTEDAITGIAVNSKTPLVGSFKCSSPMINRLYQNIVWTQRANFISVPTDCPQRDERLGWTGDAQTFVRAGTYNADLAAFYTKWLVDLEDAQGEDGNFPNVAPRVVTQAGGVAAWADAGTICPWTIYQVYNDARLLEKHYAAMVRWVEYCRKNSKNLLRPNAGYGDWLSIKADTPKDVIGTAYFAHSTHLTADAARTLGKHDDAEKYSKLFQQIKDAFNKAYVSDDGKIKGDTQTCYVLALWFDLLPDDKREAVVKRLVDDIKSRDTHISTGFVGTSVLMPALSSVGQTPLAYKLLLNDTFPSWGFSIKHGATSIWERWDGWTPEKGFQTPAMNSFAHYSFGAVGRWMFQTVAGIDMAEPGFQRLKIAPEPAEGLDWVKASYDSIHGRIATEWKTADGRLTLNVTIPANTTATVYIPCADPSAITESDAKPSERNGVKFIRTEAGRSLYEIGAGNYRFAAPYP